LSRIHRLTIAGLRKEIQPVQAATYQRFLFRHQGVVAGSRRQGANGVFEAIGQLQGLDLPTICWERDILPLRIENYRREWLDEVCLSGEIAWGRLYPPARDPERGRPMASITRVAPVSLFLREDLEWLRQTAGETIVSDLSSPAQEALEALSARGAMFSTDLQAALKIPPTQLDDILGELVARGFLTADGFAGLRNLVRETTVGDVAGLSPKVSKLIRRRRASQGMGRWSLWRAEVTDDAAGRQPAVENWAWQLMRRWGVVFRDLLERESGAPRWFELLRVYRRLEARGEIRGGRFIKGVAGEQFATSETVLTLRKLRDDTRIEVVVVAAPDPVNLAGVITPGTRVPSQAGNRVAFVNGVLAADWQGGKLSWHAGCTEDLRARVRERLLHGVEARKKAAAVDVPPGGMRFAGALPAVENADASNAPAEAPPVEGQMHVRISKSKPSPPAGIPRPRF
jgi:ATP-dependent Lhr-like helicase